MSKNHNTFSVSSSSRVQLIDITQDVERVVSESGKITGVCYIYTPHTTAAITINENADPDVQTDMVMGIEKIVPENLAYDHSEGNSPAHIKSSLVGASETIFVENGKLLLGTWQGIYFCEFDGPRERKVYVKVTEG